jgi:hypothetical protein
MLFGATPMRSANWAWDRKRQGVIAVSSSRMVRGKHDKGRFQALVGGFRVVLCDSALGDSVQDCVSVVDSSGIAKVDDDRIAGIAGGAAPVGFGNGVAEDDLPVIGVYPAVVQVR